ncbi:MAG: STAS domain-containing protein [Endozoicomonas sp.]
MSLVELESGRYALRGVVTFDNAAQVERDGIKLLSQSQSGSATDISISLAELLQADSSTLSVCLSWIRFARHQVKNLCFTGVPEELTALARVSGVEELLADSTCPGDLSTHSGLRRSD